MDLSELELSSEKEAEIDLSGVEWDVDGLNEAEPEKESAEESTVHHRRRFFKHYN